MDRSYPDGLSVGFFLGVSVAQDEQRDSELDAEELGRLVMDAPKEMWVKIRNALESAREVDTREDAVAMMRSDEKARQVIVDLLGGGEGRPESEFDPDEIAAMIEDAPKATWVKIRNALESALEVDTREEAVEMVKSDQKAAQAVAQVLGGGEAGLVSKRELREPTLLTSEGKEERSLADRLYGDQKAKAQF